MKPVLVLGSLCCVILAIVLAGCSAPLPAGSGSVQVTSSPSGAEIYLDNEYRGTTPATIPAIPAGNHTLNVRERGYREWSAPITITRGSTATISAALEGIPVTLPVTFAPAAAPTASGALPQIHVDGYWTLPPSSATAGPSSVLVHTDGFNVGYADAREVTVSANLYYNGREICWDTVYLGTLKAGSHIAKDTMVSCTLPSGLSSQDLVVRFENVIVNQ
jgi:hypothetical protein